MSVRKLEVPLARAGALAFTLAALAAVAPASPLAPQNVELQSTTPGTQQVGNENLSGTGLFGNAVGIGTSAPQAGLHVSKEADALGGTLALEGVTTTYMTFFPHGLAGGRRGYLGYTSPSSTSLWLANESTYGNIVLTPGPYGGVGVNTIPTSYQMLKVYTGAANSYAVFADNGATSGNTYGVFGRSYSTGGFGVYGLALASTGSCTGVAGRSDSTGGRGVYGSTTKTTGTCYGVYAYCASPSGYAVYAQGRTAATGTKSFVIDHPFDPANKTLSHYCTEGAEPLDVYSGKALLDANGRAWIALPDYFEEINTDPRYSLTPIGAPMPDLFVASEVRANRFEIAGGAPGMKVSWRIEGVRNDLFVQRYGAPVEQEKPAEMRGKYLSPELYGQPLELGVQYTGE